MAVIKEIKEAELLGGLSNSTTVYPVTHTKAVYNAEGTDLDSILKTFLSKEEVQSLIGKEIAELIDGAPDSYDTLKELYDLIESKTDSQPIVDALMQHIKDCTSQVEALRDEFSKDLLTESENATQAAMGWTDQRAEETLEEVRDNYYDKGTSDERYLLKSDKVDAIFTRDFTTNITVGKLNAGTKIKVGDRIEDILYNMLYKKVITQPTLSAGFLEGTSVEVGTPKSVLKCNFTKGSAGNVVSLKLDNLTTVDLDNNIGSNVSLNQGAYEWDIRSDSEMYFTHTESHTVLVTFEASEDIPTRTTLNKTATISTYKNMYSGVCNEIPTASTISNLTGKEQASAGTRNKTFNNYEMFAICVPNNFKVTSVIDTKWNLDYMQSAEDTRGMVEIDNVKGLNGVDLGTYRVYYFTSDSANSATVKITITYA